MFKFIKFNYRTLRAIIFASIAVLLIVASFPPFNFWTLKFSDLQSNIFADYGSFISGLLGSMFSLLGVILLFMTLTEQRKQYTKSSFETNFYSLLENHRNILNSICDQVEGVSTEDEKGSDFFADLAERILIDYKECEHTVNGEIVPRLCNCSSKGVERLINIYHYYFHIYNSDLGHYFRNLYHFVRFIDESEVDESTKRRHMKILRAQLTNYEILILAYNCLHKYGSKFKRYVEKYELLQNLNFELQLPTGYNSRVIDGGILIQQYPHLKGPYEEQLSW